MTLIVAIGIDPGPTPGLVALTYVVGSQPAQLVSAQVVQCSANMLTGLLKYVLSDKAVSEFYIQIEKFIIGRNSKRSGQAGKRTRDVISSVMAVAEAEQRALWPDQVVVVTQRSASDTKVWATDQRLAKGGLIEATKGMPHARDAARHALFTAVAEGKIPDPLSRKANLNE